MAVVVKYVVCRCWPCAEVKSGHWGSRLTVTRTPLCICSAYGSPCRAVASALSAWLDHSSSTPNPQGGFRQWPYSLLDVVPACHVVLACPVVVLPKSVFHSRHTPGSQSQPVAAVWPHLHTHTRTHTLPGSVLVATLTASPNIKQHKWMHFWVLHHTWGSEAAWGLCSLSRNIRLLKMCFSSLVINLLCRGLHQATIIQQKTRGRSHIVRHGGGVCHPSSSPRAVDRPAWLPRRQPSPLAGKRCRDNQPKVRHCPSFSLFESLNAPVGIAQKRKLQHRCILHMQIMTSFVWNWMLCRELCRVTASSARRRWQMQRGVRTQWSSPGKASGLHVSVLAAERGGRQAGVLCNRLLCKEVVSSVMWFSLLPRLPGHEDKLLTRSKLLLCRCILLKAGVSLLLNWLYLLLTIWKNCLWCFSRLCN